MRWRPDGLGAGWEQTTLDLGADDEGPLVATLVRCTHGLPAGDAADPRPVVLYVHGYNDYFFQAHVGERLAREGYAFYAVDLRRYGRSLRPWQTPGWTDDLTEYAEELTAAARHVRAAGHRRLVVMAHSTGGLVATLWAHALRRTDAVDALVLNSPWFDLAAPWFSRVVSTRVLDLVGPLDPRRRLSHGPSYARTLHRDAGGPWDFDVELKRPEGVPVLAGWLRAVRRGQARLARGLDVRVPVLVCVSASSGPDDDTNPSRHQQDTVLDVEQIVARAARIGPDVTVERIEGGLHDLALSQTPAREAYLDAVVTWLSRRLDLARDPGSDAAPPAGR
ncbi:alpha/beta hydrolase [Cellulomonas sp. APG4]|uniref:alpha/beta hydrolase n=1 Tax=Cellulomonas sp. APG4 TaxID=1538656 RepID=UPI00137A8FB2|nr:alpha/beta hydrolase [Cellulomonas sp. APG4]NCT90933.1 alpha/beta hydrolase [Cellulomonas sp. APG4]